MVALDEFIELVGSSPSATCRDLLRGGELIHSPFSDPAVERSFRESTRSWQRCMTALSVCAALVGATWSVLIVRERLPIEEGVCAQRDAASSPSSSSSWFSSVFKVFYVFNALGRSQILEALICSEGLWGIRRLWDACFVCLIVFGCVVYHMLFEVFRFLS